MQFIERFISLEVGQLFNVIVLNVQTLQLPKQTHVLRQCDQVVFHKIKLLQSCKTKLGLVWIRFGELPTYSACKLDREAVP